METCHAIGVYDVCRINIHYERNNGKSKGRSVLCRSGHSRLRTSLDSQPQPCSLAPNLLTSSTPPPIGYGVVEVGSEESAAKMVDVLQKRPVDPNIDPKRCFIVAPTNSVNIVQFAAMCGIKEAPRQVRVFRLSPVTRGPICAGMLSRAQARIASMFLSAKPPKQCFLSRLHCRLPSLLCSRLWGLRMRVFFCSLDLPLSSWGRCGPAPVMAPCLSRSNPAIHAVHV